MFKKYGKFKNFMLKISKGELNLLWQSSTTPETLNKDINKNALPNSENLPASNTEIIAKGD